MAFEGLSAVKPQFISLSPDTKKQLAYTLTRIHNGASVPKGDIFIVFVNGLGLPQSSWQPTISILQQMVTKQNSAISTTLTIVTYDRPGQGLSQPPNTAPPKPHDILSSVDELHGMITAFHSSTPTKVFLVAHSIGVPLARLYIQSHPNTISSLLAIDSNMANTDFVSLFPNPDAPDFRAERDLPSDTSLEQLREALGRYKRMFHPSTTNPERLDRTTLASLLPHANEPILRGADSGNPVHLSVISHDPRQFAEESLKMSTIGLTERYLEPVWQQYNEDLLSIGNAQPSEVLVAEGAGHFVQRDRPDYVAEQVWQMILFLAKSSEHDT